MKKIILITSCFFLFNFSLFAAGTVIVHENCKLYLYFDSRVLSKSQEYLNKRVKDNGFTALQIRALPTSLKDGDLYLKVDNGLVGSGLYKKCKGEVSLFVRNRDGKDLQRYHHKKFRSRPRVTLEGDTRCKLALQDVLEKFPRCELFKPPQ